MITRADLVSALDYLGIERARPVIAHASLSAFGEVDGGAQTLLGALLSVFRTLVMPAFTYKTMLTPEDGPPDNGMTYGTNQGANLMAEFFDPGMPVDRLMGAVPEALRCHPATRRSLHPILSFAGLNAGRFLDNQSLDDPFTPIGALTQAQGWVLLLGVDHTVNTSIHYAERLAGRKQFVRWALTPQRVLECPRFPGCSDGFQAIAPRLSRVVRVVHVGRAQIRAVPLIELISVARAWVEADPLALLCDKPYCERCYAVRSQVLAIQQ
jgi:aminoglycoside 3-N-acetyltransferase